MELHKIVRLLQSCNPKRQQGLLPDMEVEKGLVVVVVRESKARESSRVVLYFTYQ